MVLKISERIAKYFQLGIALSNSYGNVAFAQTGDTFTQSSFDNTPVRNAVGQLFLFTQGEAFALVILVFGILSIIAVTIKAYRTAAGMFLLALLLFGLRMYAWLFVFFDVIYPN